MKKEKLTMRSRVIHRIGLGLVVPVLALLLSVPVLALSQPEAPVQRPAQAAVTIELCASPGTVTMPDSTVVDIWGFSDNSAGCAAAQLPGPVLEVNEGDVVTINLTNYLSENVALSFPGLSLLPDTVGAAPGGSTSYVFTATKPGTYLYETSTNPSIQLPMGLYGALVVRPSGAPAQAYADASTAFDAEEVLVLSEIDPNLNANPSGFNLLDYHPVYWLINGKAYPDTDNIAVGASDSLLVRYVNAGSLHHTMQLLGLRQRIIARDGYQIAVPFDAVSETMPSGQTVDALIDVTCSTSAQSYALYNRQLHLTNVNTFPGGMLTYINAAAAVSCDVVGPTATPVPPTATNTPVPPTATATNTPQPVLTNKHIGDLDGTSSNGFFGSWTASVVVRVDNATHGAVSGATVSGSWTGGFFGGTSCTTNGTGTCTLTRFFIPGGQASVNLSVTNVTGAAAAGPYTPANNHDPDGDSNGTTITVNHP